jgi:hypothetical protein
MMTEQVQQSVVANDDVVAVRLEGTLWGCSASVSADGFVLQSVKGPRRSKTSLGYRLAWANGLDDNLPGSVRHPLKPVLAQPNLEDVCIDIS